MYYKKTAAGFHLLLETRHCSNKQKFSFLESNLIKLNYILGQYFTPLTIAKSAERFGNRYLSLKKQAMQFLYFYVY